MNYVCIYYGVNAPNFVAPIDTYAFVIIEKPIIDLVKSKCLVDVTEILWTVVCRCLCMILLKLINGLTIQKERAIIGMLSIYLLSPIPY